jgi:hypothetical protein
LYTYIDRLNDLEVKFKDTLSGEARTSLVSEVVKLLVSNAELKRDVAGLKEDISSSRSTADGGMLPAQRLEQHVAAQQRAAQPKPFFDHEKLDRL